MSQNLNTNYPFLLVSKNTATKAFEICREKLQRRLEKYGNRAYYSPHETFGILYEEVNEVLDAVQENNNDWIIEELLDVAVAALWGVASIQERRQHVEMAAKIVEEMVSQETGKV
jgi:NTP pyrophosphatase (non-canonical NTP hydrolase)